mmetsp:Transcript_68308/g.158538  ORF Transcript_68308/g.158538 Transcript_68308/m.158538 type:complete len:210 (+) Transcript_68308:584-1213(+)
MNKEGRRRRRCLHVGVVLELQPTATPKLLHLAGDKGRWVAYVWTQRRHDVLGLRFWCLHEEIRAPLVKDPRPHQGLKGLLLVVPLKRELSTVVVNGYNVDRCRSRGDHLRGKGRRVLEELLQLPRNKRRRIPHVWPQRRDDLLGFVLRRLEQEVRAAVVQHTPTHEALGRLLLGDPGQGQGGPVVVDHDLLNGHLHAGEVAAAVPSRDV